MYAVSERLLSSNCCSALWEGGEGVGVDWVKGHTHLPSVSVSLQHNICMYIVHPLVTIAAYMGSGDEIITLSHIQTTVLIQLGIVVCNHN